MCCRDDGIVVCCDHFQHVPSVHAHNSVLMYDTCSCCTGICVLICTGNEFELGCGAASCIVYSGGIVS